MQYQHTANHLASQGRNGDSMLMHVTPREVAGLQSLAQRHGGSLTVNPQTGLPEANFLDDIGLGDVNKALPAIAGAGLSYFSGGAIDPMMAAGMVGGLAGLSSGSLSQGIQAGLGAYGGAGLASGLSNMGATALTTQGMGAAQTAAEAAGLAPGTAEYNAFIQDQMASGSAAMTPASRASAGFDVAKEHPMDYLKQNAGMLGAAVLPSLMGSGEQDSGPAALTNKGYIRRYAKNPRTGALEQAEAVPVDDWGSRPAVSFGGVGEPATYADGGSVAPAVTFGGVPQSTNVRDPNDTRSDSQKAYDYLMGNTGAKNPMLFYHDQGTPAAAGAATPVDMATRTGGHYVPNASGTGYDWIPDTTSAEGFGGLQSLAAGQQRGNGSAPQSGISQGDATGAVARNAAVASNALGSYGQLALGKFANFVNPQTALSAEQAATVPVSDGVFSPVTSAGVGQGLAGSFGGSGAEAGSSTGPSSAATNSGMSNSGGWGSRDAGGGYGGGYGGGDGGGSAAGASARGGMGFGGTGSGVGGDGGGDGGGYATGGIAALAGGGLGSLGGYSDGGQLLKGPGDGVSDSIPATIGQGQPARLANNEFVIPARIVSELGNGSTDAGAKQLYAMMARIQAGRKKTIGKNSVAVDSKAVKHLPA